MSLHRSRICDVCHERIVGEYSRLISCNTKFSFRRREKIDVCPDCLDIMADALDDYYYNTEEGSEDVNYR